MLGGSIAFFGVRGRGGLEKVAGKSKYLKKKGKGASHGFVRACLNIQPSLPALKRQSIKQPQDILRKIKDVIVGYVLR